MIKVLLADDEPLIIRGVRKLVNWNRLGIEIVGECFDGTEALNLILNKSPDLAIIDICMPGLSGGASCQASIGLSTLSADISGATRWYREIDGIAETAPLRFSWSVATKGLSSVQLRIRHALEIERLPLTYIPYRETDEFIGLDVTVGSGPFYVSGKAEYHPRGDRAGILEHTMEAELGFEYAGEVLSAELVAGAEVSESEGTAFEFAIPWTVQLARASIAGKVTLYHQEEPAGAAVFSVSIPIDDRSRIFFGVKTREPVVSSPDGWRRVVHSVHEYIEIELGWTAKEDVTF